MVRFLVALFAIFSLNAHAIYSPGCGTGQVMVANNCLSTTGLKILHAYIYSGVQSTFYDASYGATRGAYQVTAGKTFDLRAAKYDPANGSVNGLCSKLLYCDNNAGADVAASCTNGVGLISGASSSGNNNDMVFGGNNSGNIKEQAIGGTAAAQKYIVVQGIATGYCYGAYTLYGYEQ